MRWHHAWAVICVLGSTAAAAVSWDKVQFECRRKSFDILRGFFVWSSLVTFTMELNWIPDLGDHVLWRHRLWWANRVGYFICNLTKCKRSDIVNTGRSFMHIINLHATLSDLTMHIVPLSCHAGEMGQGEIALLRQGRRASLGEILRRSIKGKVISS